MTGSIAKNSASVPPTRAISLVRQRVRHLRLKGTRRIEAISPANVKRIGVGNTRDFYVVEET